MKVIIAFTQPERSQVVLESFLRKGFHTITTDHPLESLSNAGEPAVLISDAYMVPRELAAEIPSRLATDSSPTLTIIYRGAVEPSSKGPHRVMPLTNMDFSSDIEYMCQLASDFPKQYIPRN